MKPKSSTIQFSKHIEKAPVQSAKSTPQKTVYSLFFEASGLGLSISLPMAIGALVGVFLDKRFSTSPTLTLSFLVFGIGIGIFNLYTYIKSISKRT